MFRDVWDVEIGHSLLCLSMPSQKDARRNNQDFSKMSKQIKQGPLGEMERFVDGQLFLPFEFQGSYSCYLGVQSYSLGFPLKSKNSIDFDATFWLLRKLQLIKVALKQL